MKKIFSFALCLSLIVCMVACSVDQVLADIDVIVQIASQIGVAVGDISPADAAVIQTFSQIATAGIQAVQTTYDAYKASGAQSDLEKLQAAIAALKTNLQDDLQALRITDPTTVAKVTAWVNLITTSLDAVLAALPQGTPSPTAAARTMAVGMVLPTAESLQARWQNEVCQGDAHCGGLVKAHRHHGFWHTLGTTLGEAKFGG